MKSLIENSICHIIDKYPSFFFNKKNVVGIGYGNKFKKKNINTKEPSIHVFVEKKLPLNQLYSHEIIPKNFFSFKTDVIETGIISTNNAPFEIITVSEDNDLLINSLQSRIRPIQGGLSISPCSEKLSGTLACVVFDNNTNKPYILSNNHILAKNGEIDKGTPICQPSVSDSKGIYLNNTIAALTNYVKINLPSTLGIIEDNFMDAAIAELYPNVEYTQEVYDVGTIKGTSEIKPEDFVYKVGRTTGYTMGGVVSTHCSFVMTSSKKISYYLKDQVKCVKMSNKGDSGALIFNDDNKAVGLSVGGCKDSTIFTPIEKILKFFNVHI